MSSLAIDNKHVRFSPFVTFLGEAEPTYPDLEESFHIEGSSVSNLFGSSSGGGDGRSSSGGGRRSSGAVGNNSINKRGSISLAEMFATERSFGQVALSDGSSSGGFSFGLSGSDFNLGGSSNHIPLAIREEDAHDLDSSDRHKQQQQQQESSILHCGPFELSDSCFPSPPLRSAENDNAPGQLVQRVPNREEANLAVGTAAKLVIMRVT